MFSLIIHQNGNGIPLVSDSASVSVSGVFFSSVLFFSNWNWDFFYGLHLLISIHQNEAFAPSKVQDFLR
jgi:hypothetical protein